MLEENSLKEKFWKNSIAKFLKNGGISEQAMCTFELHQKENRTKKMDQKV